MRIREIIFRDFRSFRGERRISFVDPLTDAARPITVIAGTNGTGKTTILDAIEALLAFVVDPDNPKDLIAEVWEGGLICLAVELFPVDMPGYPPFLNAADEIESGKVLHVAVGQYDLAPQNLESVWPNLFCRLMQTGNSKKSYTRQAGLAQGLQHAVSLMHQSRTEFYGGLIYFPHDRQLGATKAKGGPVEPPLEERQWLFRFTTSESWQGSLEQLWVWQNYLDLERRSQKRENLKGFVNTVEDILGKDRQITISEGRVQVPVKWNQNGTRNKVRLDQLPSGERQCLLLFGELARRRRKGAVISIDEPEISLHPTLQRLVIHQLQRWAREWDSQIIMATHSLEILRAVHESERIILDHLEDTTAHAEEEHARVSHN